MLDHNQGRLVSFFAVCRAAAWIGGIWVVKGSQLHNQGARAFQPGSGDDLSIHRSPLESLPERLPARGLETAESRLTHIFNVIGRSGCRMNREYGIILPHTLADYHQPPVCIRSYSDLARMKAVSRPGDTVKADSTLKQSHPQ